MRPVDRASLVRENIFPVEADLVADRKSVETRRDIDIVRHQKRLPAGEFEDEPLVPVSGVVVVQQPYYRAGAADLYVALLIREQVADGRVRFVRIRRDLSGAVSGINTAVRSAVGWSAAVRSAAGSRNRTPGIRASVSALTAGEQNQRRYKNYAKCPFHLFLSILQKAI